SQLCFGTTKTLPFSSAGGGFGRGINAVRPDAIVQPHRFCQGFRLSFLYHFLNQKAWYLSFHRACRWINLMPLFSGQSDPIASSSLNILRISGSVYHFWPYPHSTK